jgi:hypothetical protein
MLTSEAEMSAIADASDCAEIVDKALTYASPLSPLHVLLESPVAFQAKGAI